jgi:acyl-coenzyme A synthetase/AMP-(fatty) acid ligase
MIGTITTRDWKRYEAEGWWPNASLLDFFDDAARRHPEKAAVVVSGGDRTTYGELARMSNVISRALASLGVTAGDVVSMQLPNSLEFVAVHLAASRLGAITNPLLPNYRAKEVGYILDFARTKVAVIPRTYRGFDYPAMYADLQPQLQSLSEVFVVGGTERAAMRPFVDLLSLGAEAGDEPVPRSPTSGNDVTALIFTSGTESTPKGVLHTHNTTLYGTLTMARLLGLTAEDVVWMPSPVGHGTGFQWGVRQAITLGATLVFQDTWDVDEALRLIETERCSFVLSATPFVVMLLESSSLSRHDLSSLRIFGCAGAPIPRQLGEKARALIGCTLIGMWGMTECFVGSASPPTDPDEKLWATDGCAMPGAELAIFDANRSGRLGPGEIGELATRGPHVAVGYFNDPERTASTFSADGWLFSNDLATIDDDGYIRLVGRKKDMINRGGLKISTREIEDLLLDYPGVSQVAVVPLPDERVGEKGCACVVLRDGASATLSDLTGFLSSRGIAKYKLPEYLALVQSFPMTPSGKVQKFQLRDDILSGKLEIVS